MVTKTNTGCFFPSIKSIFWNFRTPIDSYGTSLYIYKHALQGSICETRQESEPVMTHGIPNPWEYVPALPKTAILSQLAKHFENRF